MRLCTLTLSGFRNNTGQTIEFEEGPNLICGENGAGKTNLLEAVFCFAGGKSFRGCRERDMIAFGEAQAKMKIEFDSLAGSQNMEMRLSRREKKQIMRNGVTVQRLSDYFGRFRAVVFTPDHMSLVKGAPEQRRRFIDAAISQTYPRHVAALSEYNKLLLQKNALLRGDMKDKMPLLSVYNEALASVGAVVTFRRREYFEKLALFASDMYSGISGGREKMDFVFETQVRSAGDMEEIKSAYGMLLRQKSASELLHRTSLCGAHKDDFTVLVNGKDARLFASQGQQRSAVLSLKIAEGEMSCHLTGEYPVFLLDDIMSELDSGRRDFISGKLEGKQVIMTGCDSCGTKNVNVISVACGTATHLG